MSPEPYYSDELVALYHGEAEQVIPLMGTELVDVLLTDPPYFNVKDDDWDRQWKQRSEFLSWLGGILDTAKPTLKPSASVWVFASPALTSTVELEVIAPRFRVLNSIRWVKEHGWHQKADPAAQRRYLTAWEGVVLAEQATDDPDEFRKIAMAPAASILTKTRREAGVSRQVLAVALVAAGLYRNEQTGAAMCSDWEHGDSLPPSAAYAVLHNQIPGLPTYDVFASAYSECLARFTHERRPFSLSRKRGPVTDVWSFATVPPYAGKHPCEKPLSMLTHMLEVSSRPGDLILDPFAGSGSTLQAARELGRRAIGVEKDERYCEWIANRLSQDTLFGGVA